MGGGARNSRNYRLRGKFRKPAGAARFTLAWIAMFALALLIIITGVDPVMVVEYSIIFSVIILPLTYLPLLMAAGDKTLMGPFVNGRLAKSLGWFYLLLICLAALAARIWTSRAWSWIISCLMRITSNAARSMT
jgi:Mn2+/Fe2+ NRAMP family transporter